MSLRTIVSRIFLLKVVIGAVIFLAGNCTRGRGSTIYSIGADSVVRSMERTFRKAVGFAGGPRGPTLGTQLALTYQLINIR